MWTLTHIVREREAQRFTSGSSVGSPRKTGHAVWLTNDVGHGKCHELLTVTRSDSVGPWSGHEHYHNVAWTFKLDLSLEVYHFQRGSTPKSPRRWTTLTGDLDHDSWTGLHSVTSTASGFNTTRFQLSQLGLQYMRIRNSMKHFRNTGNVRKGNRESAERKLSETECGWR